MATQIDVPKLIRKLRGIKNKSSGEARALRRMLRKSGHRGGLRTVQP